MQYFYYIRENDKGVILFKCLNENHFFDVLPYFNYKVSFYRSTLSQDVGQVFSVDGEFASWREGRWL